MPSSVTIHPSVDHGVTAGSSHFHGGTLHCHCTHNPVLVEVKSQLAHNHACGCTKCWKPKGAKFSVVGVVPRDSVTVLENGDKLHVVDPSAVIQRHACKGCGVHLFGRIEIKTTRFMVWTSFTPNCRRRRVGRPPNSRPSSRRSLKAVWLPRRKWRESARG